MMPTEQYYQEYKFRTLGVFPKPMYILCIKCSNKARVLDMSHLGIVYHCGNCDRMIIN